MKYSNPLKRIINASRYSLEGLYYALKNEQAFQYEFFVFICVCLAAYFFPITFTQKIIAIFLWLIVMAFELANSAAEKILDMIDKNFWPEIKAGKDMLSAAIFIMICANIFLWIMFIVKAITL